MTLYLLNSILSNLFSVPCSLLALSKQHKRSRQRMAHTLTRSVSCMLKQINVFAKSCTKCERVQGMGADYIGAVLPSAVDRR
jgi:hypothetical protein